jgi:hypothetical protein
LPTTGKIPAKKLALGEGLVGTCAVENNPLTLLIFHPVIFP